MTENNNCQWNYNRIQGVYSKFGLDFDGFIRSEDEKSILFKFRKNNESDNSYQIKRILAEIESSIFNDWQNRINSLYFNFEFNEVGRVLWRS